MKHFRVHKAQLHYYVSPKEELYEETLLGIIEQWVVTQHCAEYENRPAIRPAGNRPVHRQPAPNGFVSRMSFGSRVRAPSSAMPIASPVRSPK